MEDMKQEISIGSAFTWFLKSPKLTGLSSEEFDGFVDEFFLGVDDNAFIKGDVIYNDGESLILEVKEMTNSLFPFTLFYNEVKNRFSCLESKDDNPYRKYLCLDIASMTSLFFYDEECGYLSEAEYDDDGSFWTYGLFEGENDMRPHLHGCGLIEDISIELPQEEIESLEEQEVLGSIEDIDRFNDKGEFVGAERCSVQRVVNWFNTRDCAILTAWRQGKGRKKNDEDNQVLQRKLRDLGYGVTRITGWYAEKDKELSRENSFLTVNLNEEKDFRDNIFKLSEEYDQDSFLYKEAGHDTPAVYVYTNDAYGKGKVKLLGRLRIGNMDAETYSQIKAGRITFEKFDE